MKIGYSRPRFIAGVPSDPIGVRARRTEGSGVPKLTVPYGLRFAYKKRNISKQLMKEANMTRLSTPQDEANQESTFKNDNAGSQSFQAHLQEIWGLDQVQSAPKFCSGAYYRLFPARSAAPL